MDEEVIGLDLGEEEADVSEKPAVDAPVEPAAQEKPKEVSSPDEVPEKYAFADESDAFSSQIGDTARELGIGQDKAQRLLNSVYAAQEKETFEQAKAWVAEAKKDPELGSNFDETQRVARRALDANIKDKNFLTLLAESGIGCHPEFIRMMYRIGKRMPAEEPKRSLFPNSHMEH